jgi:large subunit ribosomal protein L1
VGKASFEADKLFDNANEILQMILKLKPASAKGTYLRSVYLSSTMSPSVLIETKSLA